MYSLPTSTLQLGRAISDANLPHRCTVRRPAGTADYVNGEPPDPPFVTRDTDVPCRVRAAGTVEQRAVAGQLDAPAKFQVTFTVGTLVDVGDQIDEIAADDPTLTFPATLKIVGDAEGGAGRAMRKMIAEPVPA